MIFFNPGIAIIGWGKPVNISLPNHKSKVRDDILITLAGPFSNVAIAFTVTFIFGLWGRIDGVSEASFDLLFLIFLRLYNHLLGLNDLHQPRSRYNEATEYMELGFYKDYQYVGLTTY